MGLSIEQIEVAIKQKGGNISDAATALGVTRQALHLRIAKSKVLQQLVTDSRETMVDVAESALGKQVKEGNIAAIIFTLKTLGKARGYVERNEISGPNGGPIEASIVKGYVSVTPDDWDERTADRNL